METYVEAKAYTPECCSFDIDDAINYGLHEAILIEVLKDLTFKGGPFVWVKFPMKKWRLQVPFLSTFQLSKALKSLQDQQVIEISRMTNVSNIDNTRYYRFKSGTQGYRTDIIKKDKSNEMV